MKSYCIGSYYITTCHMHYLIILCHYRKYNIFIILLLILNTSLLYITFAPGMGLGLSQREARPGSREATRHSSPLTIGHPSSLATAHTSTHPRLSMDSAIKIVDRQKSSPISLFLPTSYFIPYFLSSFLRFFLR